METIFDLSEVERITDENHSKCLVIIDTNILMNKNTLDIPQWNLPMDNPIFVLSDVILAEIVMNWTEPLALDG